jgi:glycosyltransferase involved in cell wall biosynthesis
MRRIPPPFYENILRKQGPKKQKPGKEKMKIGFDGRHAERDLVGVGKYIVDLVSEIVRRDIKCVIFYSQRPRQTPFTQKITIKVLHSINRYTFEQNNLPKALIQEKIDVYHAAGNLGVPIFCPVPAVLTIHDIIPILVKDYFKYSKYKFISKYSYLFRTRTSALKAKEIIAVSEFTKKTIVNNLGVKQAKIKVIHYGAPKVSHKSNKLPAGLKPQKYVLNQGGLDLRKNLSLLISAFSRVIEEIPDLKLVIAGENEVIKRELKSGIRSLNIEKSVVFPGYVGKEGLWSLIRQANCICYPSLFEGFGRPVLEGFVAGVPVITSKTSSLPEVSGQAAYLVDPEKEDEITQAILEVVKNKNLRKKMVERGKQRIKKFSWSKNAEETIKIYKKAMK